MRLNQRFGWSDYGSKIRGLTECSEYDDNLDARDFDVIGTHGKVKEEDDFFFSEGEEDLVDDWGRD